MILRPSHRLPKQFARPASKETMRFVMRRMKRSSRSRRRDRVRREVRRMGAAVAGFRRWGIRTSIALFAVLAVAAIGMFLFSPIVAVREIEVTRQSPRLDIEEAQNALAPLFGRHLLFLTSYQITELLRENIADLKLVKVGKAYPSTLYVSIELQPLVARLRVLNPDEHLRDDETGTGSAIHFLTEEGIFVSTIAAQDTETLPLIMLVDWSARPKHGDPLISAEFLERMNAAEIALLRQFGKEVSRRTVFLRAQEFHLHIPDIDLWFDLKSPLEDQFRRYRLFLQAVPPSEVREYVDLRIGDRVIYK